MNRDAEYFTDPLRFDGFRFARGKRSPFTDTSGSSLLWGTGRVIWQVACVPLLAILALGICPELTEKQLVRGGLILV